MRLLALEVFFLGTAMTSSSVRECGGCAATQVPIAQPGDGSGRPATASNPGRPARPSGLELELPERRPARGGRAFARVFAALPRTAAGETAEGRRGGEGGEGKSRSGRV